MYPHQGATHTIQGKQHVEEFINYVNSIDQNIKLTKEAEQNNALAFLDTLTEKQPDGNLKLKKCQKPTHTDQYLHFEPNQPLHHKLSVIRTLYRRAKVWCPTVRIYIKRNPTSKHYGSAAIRSRPYARHYSINHKNRAFLLTVEWLLPAQRQCVHIVCERTREAFYVGAHGPTLSTDGGRFNLARMWDKLIRSQTT